MDRTEIIHYSLNISIGCTDADQWLIAKTVCRLPEEIGAKVINNVIFTSVDNIYGRYELLKAPLLSERKKSVHLIILNLADISDQEEQLYVIAHEIAHFHLDHCNNLENENMEDEADNLCKQWGFAIPDRRTES